MKTDFVIIVTVYACSNYVQNGVHRGQGYIFYQYRWQKVKKMSKKTLKQYEDEIISIHAVVKEYPDNEALQNKLKYRVSKWADLLEITYYIASNEQTPWELKGLNTKPMPLKRSSGYPQTGDYLFTITGYDEVDRWGHLCVERKSCEDFYGSLMRSDNRTRLYNEITRYESDLRFNKMIIIAECTQQQFLDYIPNSNYSKNNRNHTGASIESRRATVAGLFMRGVPVMWAGNRKEAQETYLQLIRQSILKNYELIIPGIMQR